MTGSVSKTIVRISNYGLFLSLVMLAVVSLIDVVPWKQEIVTRLFYFLFSVFIISLIISLSAEMISISRRRKR